MFRLLTGVALDRSSPTSTLAVIAAVLTVCGPLALAHSQDNIFLRDEVNFEPNVAHSLPSDAILPAHCREFTTACKAEAAQRWEEAFQYYESQYSDCGDYAWKSMGNGTGSRHVVLMKTTPCGLPVAIKRNKPKECDLLKALAAAASGKLFPAYYYYSNTTYGCYSEYLDYVKWSDALPAHAQREYSPAQLRTIKTLFLQGVTAVHKLRSLGWEHRDMGFRNWAFRNFPDSSGEPHWQFTIFDLGGALPFNRTKASYKRERRVRRLRSVDDVLDGSLKEKSAAYTRALGRNGFHTDMYMLASEFYAVLRVPGYEEGPQSIAHALKAIAFANNDRQEPDYVEIARLISVAKH